MFWSKSSPRDIRQEMANLVRELKMLKGLEATRERIIERGGKVLALLNDAKADLAAEAERIKTFPWIDQRFDSVIDNSAGEEQKILVRLERELTDLLSMAAGVETSENMRLIQELISNEATILSERDEATKKLIADMERQTLADRLKTMSVAPLALQTKDGVRWADIARVVRQLGGWMIKTTGAHKQAAVFPGAKRNIPLSEDVKSYVLAKEIVPLLEHLGPRKARALTVKKMQDALKAGDIHAAA